MLRKKLYFLVEGLPGRRSRIELSCAQLHFSAKESLMVRVFPTVAAPVTSVISNSKRTICPIFQGNRSRPDFRFSPTRTLKQTVGTSMTQALKSMCLSHLEHGRLARFHPTHCLVMGGLTVGSNNPMAPRSCSMSLSLIHI